MNRNRRSRVVFRWAAVAAIGAIGFLLWARGVSPASTSKTSSQVVLKHLDLPQIEVEGLGETVGGFVTDVDGRPIASASVCASCYGCNRHRSDVQVTCASTAEDGAYKLAVTTSEALSILASATGFLPQRTSAPIYVAHDAAPTRVDLTLQPGGAEVSGNVVDVLGGPVPHADVRLVSGFGLAQQGTVVTSDENGAFRMWAANGMFSVVATANGYAAGRFDSFAPAQGLQIALTPGASISGQVLNSRDHRPVPDVELRARTVLSQNDREDAFNTSDAGGMFLLQGLYPGRYEISARAEHWRALSVVTANLDLGVQARDVVIMVEPAAAVRGRFTIQGSDGSCDYATLRLLPGDSAARPKPDVRSIVPIVPAYFGRGRPDGTILVKGVASGRYRVEADCAERVLREGPSIVTVGDTDVVGLEWRFDPGQQLNVRTVDTSGNPISDVVLSLDVVRSNDGMNEAVQGGTSNPQGRYEFKGLVPGVYSVSALSLPNTKSVQVELSPGETSESVTITSLSDSELRLRLKTSSGSPLSDIEMYAMRDVDEQEKAHSPTSALPISPQPIGGGEFVFKHLLPGRYEVFVSDRRNATLRVPQEAESYVLLAKNERRVLDVEYSGYQGRLTGYVVDGEGSPIPDAWVSARHATAESPHLPPYIRSLNGEKRSLTARDGTFEIHGLDPAARYDVRLEHPLGGYSVLKRDLPVGSRVALTLTAPGTASGVVVDAEGVAVSRFDLSAVSTSNDVRFGTSFTDERGRWSIEQIPPGSLAITVVAPQGSAVLAVEIKPGQALRDLQIALTPTTVSARAPTL